MKNKKPEYVNIYVPTRQQLLEVMKIMEKEMKSGEDILNASVPAQIYLREKKFDSQQSFTIMSVVMYLFEISKIAERMNNKQ